MRPEKPESISMAYDRVLKTVADTQLHLEEYISTFKSNVAYRQYARGCDSVHRGYYCPSIIFDVIVGNTKRGRLIKNKSAETDPAYMYGFDAADQLIFVDSVDGLELIFHENENQVGVKFSPCDNSIGTICDCQYQDGRISTYSYTIYDPYHKSIDEIWQENYTYLENQVIVDLYRFLNNPYAWGTEKRRYTFEVEDGYLTSYQVQAFDENGSKKNYWDNHIFKIRLSRKVY